MEASEVYHIAEQFAQALYEAEWDDPKGEKKSAIVEALNQAEQSPLDCSYVSAVSTCVFDLANGII